MGTPASWTQTGMSFYTSTSNWLYGLYFLNGNWFAVGFTGSTYTMDIWTTTNVRSASWTLAHQVDFGLVNTGFVGDMFYDGTDYVLFFNGNDDVSSSPPFENKVAYATNPTGTWTTSTINITDYVMKSMYVNGNYVISGYVSGGSGRYWYSSTKTGTYAAASITNMTAPARMFYENGYYYLFCNISGVASLLRSTALDGTWTSIYTFTGESFQATGPQYDKIYKRSDGTYVVIFTNTRYVYTASSIEGSWAGYSISASINMTNLFDVFKGGTYWVQCGMYNPGTKQLSIAYSTTGLGGTWSQSTLSYTNYAVNNIGVRGAYDPTSREMAVISSGRVLVLTTDGIPFDPTDTIETSLGIFEPPDMAVVCQVDLSFMTSLYTVEIRCYTKQSSGGTKKLLFSESFAGAQAEPVWQSIPVVNPYYVEFTAVTSSELPVPSGYYFVHQTGNGQTN
jgi:hypothetical protein